MRIRTLHLGFAAGLIGLAVAVAGPANANCYPSTQAASPQTVSGFISNPSQLLQRFPNGGPQLISQVRDLVASDPATLDVMLNLLANANAAQKTAIGSGFAQAARICVRGDQGYSVKIQESVAKTKDEQVWLAYTAAIGDVQLGGVGGGQGAGGGAVGGQTNPLAGGPNSTGAAQPIPGSSTPTGNRSTTSSVSGLSGPSGGSNSSNLIIIGGPVSQ